ncbi:unnamed protein product [Lactuca virosa]|uniref:Uncharacterized protein n=1 Tax=Lactuca virosa TaxID=75947 RepID=A0AAU9LZT9_9ASTR|nr:unnamed protein product [Lactuca virosa]
MDSALEASQSESSKYVPPNLRPKGSTTTVFHDCPIEPDSEMKRVESEAEASHLAKSVLEVAAKNPPENPLLEKENPKSLSAVAVFQHKLFRSRFGCFVASTTDSSVVTPIPILSDTMTENEEPVDTEATISNPPSSVGPIIIIGKEATMPTLITLVASLP